MNPYLLDTNILSELGKPHPDVQVSQLVGSLDSAWLSMITVHEIEFGIQLLPDGKRRARLASMVRHLLNTYAGQVIPVDDAIARQAARLRAGMQRQGRVVHLADTLIAGTALVHGLTLMTCNTRDFIGLPIDLHNPYEKT